MPTHPAAGGETFGVIWRQGVADHNQPMHLTSFGPACAGLSIALLALACSEAHCAQPGKKKPAVVRSDTAPDVVTYGRRDDVVAFARQAAEVRGLDADWAAAQLAQARYQPSVAKLVMPPPAGVAKNWEAYRARFVEPQRIREGLRWWQANEAALARAEARWGVPADIVAAIVGVETFYGRILGNYKVIDALSTLAFDFPSGRSDRSSFYRDELGAFLQWSSNEGRDPQSVKGSYAGAIGLPQFMPSSILKYAIDFDEDGRIDLDTHGADVVGSVAHYFAQFGWQRDLPTHYPVAPPSELRDRALLLAPDILPSFSPAQFTEHGAVLDEAGLAHSGPLALVELHNGDNAPTYVAGTRNFYVVTRYNWSSYYAMAVIELARAMRQMRPPPPMPATE
jgi:membrane-bound lytic murein transglycosylase B